MRQQHARPVLRFVPPDPACMSTNAIVRVHLAREHPGELEALELLRDAGDLTDQSARVP
jgi:hypothetical protein